MDRDSMFLFLVCFWVTLIVLSNIFQVDLSKTKGSDIGTVLNDNGNDNIITQIFDLIDDIPVINWFMPLIKILSFQYGDAYPVLVSTFLWIPTIISLFIIVTIIRGV